MFVQSCSGIVIHQQKISVKKRER